MLKQAKARAKAESSSGGKPKEQDLQQSVLESSRQIWLAGLGAFSKAQAADQVATMRRLVDEAAQTSAELARRQHPRAIDAGQS